MEPTCDTAPLLVQTCVSNQLNGLAAVNLGSIIHDCRNAVVMAQRLLHFGHGRSSGTVQNGLLGSSVRCSWFFE